MILPILFQIR